MATVRLALKETDKRDYCTFGPLPGGTNLPNWVGGSVDAKRCLRVGLDSDLRRRVVYLTLPSGKKLVHDDLENFRWKFVWSCREVVIYSGEERIDIVGDETYTFKQDVSYSTVSSGFYLVKNEHDSIGRIGFAVADDAFAGNKLHALFGTRDASKILWFGVSVRVEMSGQQVHSYGAVSPTGNRILLLTSPNGNVFRNGLHADELISVFKTEQVVLERITVSGVQSPFVDVIIRAPSADHGSSEFRYYDFALERPSLNSQLSALALALERM